MEALLVVGVLDGVADVDVLGDGSGLGGEVEVAVGRGCRWGTSSGRLPLRSRWCRGGERSSWPRRRVIGDGLAVDEDDLEILLVDPDFALEVALPFFKALGAGLEDVGVEVVDLLAAEVGDVVFGEIVGLEDERGDGARCRRSLPGSS